MGLYYADQYHVYNDTWACYTVNYWRCAYIILAGDIQSLSQMPTLLSHYISTSASEICASVAFHFGKRPIKSQRPLYDLSRSPIHGVAILWPLVVAATTGSEPREWVTTCLGMMAERMMISKGLLLQSALADKQNVPRALSSREPCYFIRPTWAYAIREVLLSVPGGKMVGKEIKRQIAEKFPLFREATGAFYEALQEYTVWSGPFYKAR